MDGARPSVPSAARAVDVLLVGGGVAAARCARTLRRRGFAGSILLVGAEGRVPYNRPPLSKEMLRDDLPSELLDAESPAWYERRRVELMLDATVERIDAEGQLAAVPGLGSIRFERLLIATGAEVRRLQVPGAEQSLTLRTADDAVRLRAAAVAARKSSPVVIVGGGFIGLEVASSLASLGLRPTVVELSDTLWGGTLGIELGTWAAARLAEAGVGLRLGAGVDRIGEGAAWIGDERLPAALVAVGVGVRPRAELAETAGLRVEDGIVVDDGQRTEHPAIWAAGDVARIAGRPRIEHWHAAREAGERAALSMLGLPLPPAPAPWVFSEIGGTAIDVFGATEGWDQEAWLDGERTVLAFLRSAKVVGLAAVGGALGPEAARKLVESAVTRDEALAAIA